MHLSLQRQRRPYGDAPSRFLRGAQVQPVQVSMERAPVLGLQLHGRELAAEAQLLILSFLEPAEMASLLCICKGWRSILEAALARFDRPVTVFAQNIEGLTRYCRRLRSLRFEGLSTSRGASLARLIAQNCGTLTDIEMVLPAIGDDAAATAMDALFRALCTCRSLRRLVFESEEGQGQGRQLLESQGKATVERLFTACPFLEELGLPFLSWPSLLSECAPRLRRLINSSPLDGPSLSRLLALYGPQVETLSLQPDAVDLAVFFRSLADSAPRLSALSLRLTERTPVAQAYAQRERGDAPPELRALRTLTLSADRKGGGPLCAVLPFFSSPNVTELEITDWPALPFAPLLRHFPALTSLSVDTFVGPHDGEAAEDAVALLSSEEKAGQGRWKGLRSLRYSVFTGTRMVPFLAVLAGAEGGKTEQRRLLLPSLTRLQLCCSIMHHEDAEALFRAFPRLTALDLSMARCGEQKCRAVKRRARRTDDAETAAPSPLPLPPSADHLQGLSVEGVPACVLTTVVAAAALRFPSRLPAGTN